MSGKKQARPIGFDPLVWMKDESPESNAPAQAGVSTEADTPAPANAAHASSAEQQVEQGSEAVVRLPEAATIAEAEQMRTMLRAALEGADPVVLDGGQVERIDGAGLQVLAAFFRQARAASRETCWRSCSDKLAKSADLLGLASIMCLE
jgi:anti-anti-sigma regulatory factor